MQRHKIQTNGEPIKLLLGVRTMYPTKVKVKVLNPNKRGTVYLDRFMTVNKAQEFEIRLPKTCDVVDVLVGCEGDPHNVRVTHITKEKLKQYTPCFSDKKIMNFVKFAQEFCENASILEPQRVYSDDGVFMVDYLPVIKDNGKAIPTPARISDKTGRMEISKQSFARYSVPMRMAIILHEFAHFNMNIEQKDETEADLNALKVYLALGYPVVEAHNAFTKVFQRYDTPANRERYTYIKTFIDNFDDLKSKICGI